ncbi:geranylgeranyl diphosphate synthase, type II [Lachnospiraceae bacterium XPB1003]|nr:geranylgeranyl diphosphate synthase, type II [Lachnospiraceae bacterium XPB1003]
MEFTEELKKRTAKCNRIIKKYLPKEEEQIKTVTGAMNYCVNAGGKRLRPVIMKAAYEMCGGKGDLVEPFCAAIEMIHTYSLVHDDLPEMDDAMLRRGRPTAHVKYGAGMAVLAGDGLLNFAYETALKSMDLAQGTKNEDEKYVRIIKAARVLADKAGIYGMVGGQALDVEAEKKNMDLDEDQVLFVYANKTAALLQASFMCGAILAGASDDVVADLATVGYDLGVAFQLQDDILDVTGTVQETGKSVGIDEKDGKKTYLSYHGLEETSKEQMRLSAEAVALLDKIPANVDGNKDATLSKAFLEGLIRSLTKRRS